MGVWGLAPSFFWGSGGIPQRVQRAEPLRGARGRSPRKFFVVSAIIPRRFPFSNDPCTTTALLEAPLFFDEESVMVLTDVEKMTVNNDDPELSWLTKATRSGRVTDA
eukprot:scaffold3865_cov107-Cylindrotheca_fusiformis.AAC.2